MRAVIIPRLEGGSIGPRMESLGNWNGPMAMVPCLQKGNIYTKRKLRVWRDQKYIPLFTKEIFIPKGSYGYGETRNVFR